MKRRAILSAVLTLMVVFGQVGDFSASATETQDGPGGPAVRRIFLVERPEQRIHSRDPAVTADARWALERFELAGLDLPTVDIYFHTSPDGCEGNLGLRTRRNEIERIDVCSQARRVETLLHELAHVWAGHTLTEGRRQAFLRLRGLEVWSDTSVVWNRRGSEQAAEVIGWGVGDARHLPGIFRAEPDVVAVAFALLTGGEPLNSS